MCGNGLYFSVIFGLLISPVTAFIIYKLGNALFFRHLPQDKRTVQLRYWCVASVLISWGLPVSALFAPDPELAAYKARAALKAGSYIHHLELSPDDSKVCNEGAVTGYGPAGHAVVCTHAVAPGAVIKKDDVMIAPVDALRVPQKTLKGTAEAVGHISKYGLSRGQIVNELDLQH